MCAAPVAEVSPARPQLSILLQDTGPDTSPCHQQSNGIGSMTEGGASPSRPVDFVIDSGIQSCRVGALRSLITGIGLKTLDALGEIGATFTTPPRTEDVQSALEEVGL